MATPISRDDRRAASCSGLRPSQLTAPKTYTTRRDITMGNPGQHRVLTGGVLEMKIDHGPGYRVYYTQRGLDLILLLIGGDKSSQHEDIRTALRIAKDLE